MTMNLAQRTALVSTLIHLERALIETEQMLDHPPRGVTFTTDVDWSEACAHSLRDLCAAARSQIAEMVDAFDLPIQHLNGRRIVVGEMSIAWVNLEELRPGRLRRYGDVDPALSETLTPRLERLMERVLAIQSLAGQQE